LDLVGAGLANPQIVFGRDDRNGVTRNHIEQRHDRDEEERSRSKTLQHDELDQSQDESEQ